MALGTPPPNPRFASVPSFLLQVVDRSLMYSALPERDLREHVESVEDQDALRGMLQKEGLVAFVRNGAILPRASGAADTPMSRNCAIPFESPPHLERTLSLPNRGPISGMGIPHGITVIVGGGFNGKSTLLQVCTCWPPPSVLPLGAFYVLPPAHHRSVAHSDPHPIDAVASQNDRRSCNFFLVAHCILPRDRCRIISSGKRSHATSIRGEDVEKRAGG